MICALIVLALNKLTNIFVQFTVVGEVTAGVGTVQVAGEDTVRAVGEDTVRAVGEGTDQVAGEDIDQVAEEDTAQVVKEGTVQADLVVADHIAMVVAHTAAEGGIAQVDPVEAIHTVEGDTNQAIVGVGIIQAVVAEEDIVLVATEEGIIQAVAGVGTIQAVEEGTVQVAVGIAAEVAVVG